MNRKPRTCPSVLAAVANAAWCIQPDKMGAILSFLLARNSGVIFTAEEVAARTGGDGSDPAEYFVQDGVAVIPVHGVISQRMPMMADVSGGGGASTEQISMQFDSAMSDKQVKAIVFDIDSPGGTSGGVMELSSQIFQARGKKPIISVANGQMASAAYWIGSSADKIVAAPSAWSIGSVGVYALHSDYSRMMANEGITNTFIKAGKYKTEGNDLEPLTEEAKTDIQRMVDAVYGDFLADLTRNRGQVAARKSFGDGRTFTSKEAISERMVDEIGTLGAIVGQMATNAGRRKAMASEIRNLEISCLG
jgi:signal peptide peptidase SppA